MLRMIDQGKNSTRQFDGANFSRHQIFNEPNISAFLQTFSRQLLRTGNQVLLASLGFISSHLFQFFVHQFGSGLICLDLIRSHDLMRSWQTEILISPSQLMSNKDECPSVLRTESRSMPITIIRVDLRKYEAAQIAKVNCEKYKATQQ